MKKFTILLLFILNISFSFSQRENKIIVNLDADAGEFKSEDIAKIPFDQNFFIHGKTKNNKIKLVDVRYKLLNYNKKKHYFIDSTTVMSDDFIEVGRDSVKNGAFQIFAPKLHPNEYYEFEFTFQENIDLPEAKNNQLRLSLITAIDKSVSYKNSKITESNINALSSEVSKSIRHATGKKPLYFKSNEPIENLSNLLLKDNAINSAFQNLTKYNADIYEAQKKLLFVDWKSNGWSKHEIVYKIIKELNSKKSAIIDAVTFILEEPSLQQQINTPANTIVNPNISLRDMFQFLISDYARSNFDIARNETNFPTLYAIDILDRSQSYFLEVLVGNAKIKGNIIEKTDGYQKESVQLVLATLIQLQSIKKEDGSTVLPNNEIDELVEYLLTWLNLVKVIDDNQSNINLEKKVNAQLLTDVTSSFSFRTDADTFVTIDTEKSPYIGIDFGVLVAPKISSTFFFEGLNFHLRPVNRKAKFSDLEGWDMWLKRTSVFFGVAQRIGSYDDNYKNLVGVGSPFVGIGFRINRMIRLNGGYMFYKTEDTHPLSSSTSINSTYFLSASIDIELKKALTIIGNFL